MPAPLRERARRGRDGVARLAPRLLVVSFGACGGSAHPRFLPGERVDMIESISAFTLATHDMQRAVSFYSSLGFDMLYGGETVSFTSFRAGPGYLNLIA